MLTTSLVLMTGSLQAQVDSSSQNVIVIDRSNLPGVQIAGTVTDAATKKGIACRFTVRFEFENKTILEYVGEDSYVIDLQDIIDKSELQRMIRNSYSKFNEKFEFKKFGTVLRDKSLLPFDETKYDLDPVLILLQ